MDDFSPQVKPRKRRGSKLDPFKATIDRWLAEDRKRRPKQRHTAQRVFDRLVAECGYDGSYTIVQAYVKKRKASSKAPKTVPQPRMGARRGAGRLRRATSGCWASCARCTTWWSPSRSPMCRWRNASGARRRNASARPEGRVRVLRGVPTRLVFDNATGVGRRVGQVVSTADTFTRSPPTTGSTSPSATPTPPREISVKCRRGHPQPFVPFPASTACPPTTSDPRQVWIAPARTITSKTRAPAVHGDEWPWPTCRRSPPRREDSHGQDRQVRRRVPRRQTPLPARAGPRRERVIVELGAFRAAFYDGEGTQIAAFDRAYGDRPKPDPCRSWRSFAEAGRMQTAPSGDLAEIAARSMDSMGRADRGTMLRMLRDVSADAATRPR